MPLAVFLFYQESSMPEPSELFTNVYVKGFGIEVNFMSLILVLFLFLTMPFLGRLKTSFFLILFAVNSIDLDTTYW